MPTVNPSPDDVTYVRLLIADPFPGTILTDSAIESLIQHASGGNLLLAAADALDAIATSEVLLSKKITVQDLATDGPAVAAELRQQAANLRKRVRDEVVSVQEEWAFETFTLTPQRPPEATELPRWW